jgi:hypothetical protein
MLFYWTTVLGKRCLFVLGSIIPRAGMPVDQRDICTVTLQDKAKVVHPLRVCNAPSKMPSNLGQRLLGDVGETLGEDHERCHSVFSWRRPNSCRATILMLPNGDWRSADRPACAALAGQLPDAQQIVTILDIFGAHFLNTSRHPDRFAQCRMRVVLQTLIGSPPISSAKQASPIRSPTWATTMPPPSIQWWLRRTAAS